MEPLSRVTSLAPALAPTQDRRGLVPPPPSAEQVVLLQAVRSYPAVSLLLNTTPASSMTPGDAATLRRMVEEAARRLRAEGLAGSLVETLDGLVRHAMTEPTGRALAVYASAGMARALPLPVAVRERVVVDPTFATRDLVRALHRTPRHLVLAVTSREARLFDGVGETLRPVPGSSFPLRSDRQRGNEPGRARRKDADTAAFFRNVDVALGAYLRLHPAPLVLVGQDRVLAGFRAVSKNLGRLAGSIEANLATEPLTTLVTRTRPVLEDYLRSRQDEALALLERRAGLHRAVSGMSSAWLAARSERPEMLAVEEGLFYPARLSSDGDLLQHATDVEHPDVIDDAVDELIELVLDRGGWVALVEDGALAAHDGVALTLRSRP